MANCKGLKLYPLHKQLVFGNALPPLLVTNGKDYGLLPFSFLAGRATIAAWRAKQGMPKGRGNGKVRQQVQQAAAHICLWNQQCHRWQRRQWQSGKDVRVIANAINSNNRERKALKGAATSTTAGGQRRHP
jgi:hypothetical protein